MRLDYATRELLDCEKKLNFIARNIRYADWKWFEHDMITFLNRIVYTEDNWGFYSGFIAINAEGNILITFNSGSGMDAPKWNEGEVPEYKYRSKKVYKDDLANILKFMPRQVWDLTLKIDHVYYQVKDYKKSYSNGVHYIPC